MLQIDPIVLANNVCLTCEMMLILKTHKLNIEVRNYTVQINSLCQRSMLAA